MITMLGHGSSSFNTIQHNFAMGPTWIQQKWNAEYVAVYLLIFSNFLILYIVIILHVL